MKRLKSLTIPLAIFAVAGLGKQAMGYEVETHKVINEAIYNVSALRTYFENELLIPLTASQTFQGKNTLKLLQDAGVAEDNPPYYFRAWNHYHDPILNWGEAGYTNPILPDGMSSVQWAQDLSTDLSGPNLAAGVRRFLGRVEAPGRGGSRTGAWRPVHDSGPPDPPGVGYIRAGAQPQRRASPAEL